MKYQNKFNLKNKTAYVLGGSGLIGEEICLALAEFGAQVLNLDIKKNKKINLKEKKNIKFHNFKISNLNTSDKLLSKIIKKHGTPDIFINCSYPHSKSWKNSSLKNITVKSFQENVNLHMNSYIWIARLIAEKMKKKKVQGSIVQLSSIYGVVGQNMNIYKGTNIKENISYSAIKGGITNSTRLMASYYGKYNIRVNTICPGGIENKQSLKLKKQYASQAPIKRMCKVEEIPSAVIFLASEASSYVTGITLMVDGGWTAI